MRTVLAIVAVIVIMTVAVIRGVKDQKSVAVRAWNRPVLVGLHLAVAMILFAFCYYLCLIPMRLLDLNVWFAPVSFLLAIGILVLYVIGIRFVITSIFILANKTVEIGAMSIIFQPAVRFLKELREDISDDDCKA